MEKTRVFYYIDMETAAHSVQLNAEPQNLRLGDFKTKIKEKHQGKNFKFEIQINIPKLYSKPFREEISEDDSIIPMVDGFLTIWLITQEPTKILKMDKSSQTYSYNDFPLQSKLSSPVYIEKTQSSETTPLSTKLSKHKTELSPSSIQLNYSINTFYQNISQLRETSNCLAMTGNENDFYLLNSNIFIRNTYISLFNILCDHKDTNKFIILGNPGIGKSYFGYYLVWKFIQDKQPFIYQPQDNDFKDTRYIYGELSESDISPPEYCVRLLDANKEALNNEQLKKAWFITDSFFPSSSYADKCLLTLFITSPKNQDVDSDSRRLCSFLKNFNKKYLYMPVWSRDEMLALCECLYPSNNEKKSCCLDLFSIFGGIPRYCLSNCTITDAKSKICGDINKCQPIKLLESVYTSAESHHPDLSQSLIHFNIDPKTCAFYDDQYNFKIASRFALTQINKFYREDIEKYSKKLIYYATSKSYQNTEFNSYVGEIFENWAFSQISSQKPLHGRSLQFDSFNISSQISHLENVKKFEDGPLDQINWSDPDILNQPVLWIMPPSFPSIDALLICESPCFFQMTTGTNHDIKANVQFVEIIDKLLSLLGKADFKFVYFFVVPSTIFDKFSAQKITHSSHLPIAQTLNKLKFKKESNKYNNNPKKLDELENSFKKLSAENNSDCQKRFEKVSSHIHQYILKIEV